MYEKQTDLKDVVIKVLCKWRLLLTMMLVGGIIFGVYGYFSIQREREELIGDTGRYYLTDLTEEQAENIAYFLEYEKQYKVAKKNFGQSVMQKLDTSKLCEVDDIYAVSGEDMEKAYAIEKAYEQLIMSNEFYERISEVYKDISPDEVPKILYIKRDDTNIDTGRVVFTVTFLYDDENVCQSVSNILTDYILALIPEFKDMYGEVNVKQLSSTISKSNPESIISSKLSELSRFEEIKNKYFQLKNTVTKEEIKIYKANKEDNSIMIYAKKAIVGIILFLMLTVVVIVLKYMLNKSIKTDSEIEDVYRISVLGVINRKRENKKIFGFVDRFIRKLEIGKQGIIDQEEVEEIISTQVSLMCNKDEMSNIGIIECDIDNESKMICNEMVSKIKSDKINVLAISQLRYDSKEMMELNEMDGVVLVVTLNGTQEDELEEQLSIIKRQDIKILGCVVIR